MRDFSCFIYHFEDKKLVKNSNTACWAGLLVKFKKQGVNGTEYIDLDSETKDYIYIDRYIEDQITNEQRKRIVYLINKITPCSFVLIENKNYIRYTLLKNCYSNLLLLNFIRILWYKNDSFNNKQFFIDICKIKTKGLDYLEFMMTCIKNNVDKSKPFGHGDHSFVYPNIIPKTKEMLLNNKYNQMFMFLQSKAEDI